MNIEDLTLEEAWHTLYKLENDDVVAVLDPASSDATYLLLKFGNKLDDIEELLTDYLRSQSWMEAHIRREYGKQMAIIKAELAAATEQLVSEQINRLVQKKGGGHHHLIEQENKKKHRRGK